LPSPSASPEAGAFGSKDGFATGAQVDLSQDTGAEELVEPAEYSGPPRQIADVHHLSCLMGLPGVSEIPETESSEPAMEPWDFTAHQQLPQGWKECRLASMGSFQVPASFSIEQITADQAEITDAVIRDAMGQTIGGYHLAQEPTTAPEGLTVVDAPEVTALETPETDQGSERYLRTLVVDSPSGPHLLIDQVSVPTDADPASLEHWDVVRNGGSSHSHVWASIPLESADAPAAAMDTHLYREARSMVASYMEGQQ